MHDGVHKPLLLKWAKVGTPHTSLMCHHQCSKSAAWFFYSLGQSLNILTPCFQIVFGALVLIFVWRREKTWQTEMGFVFSEKPWCISAIPGPCGGASGTWHPLLIAVASIQFCPQHLCPHCVQPYCHGDAILDLSMCSVSDQILLQFYM